MYDNIIKKFFRFLFFSSDLIDCCGVKGCDNTNIKGYKIEKNKNIPYCTDHKEGELFVGQHTKNSNYEFTKDYKIRIYTLSKIKLLIWFLIIVSLLFM